MATNKYYDNYKDTIRKLEEGTLQKALDMQRTLIDGLGDWSLMDNLCQTQHTYNTMLDYYAKGVADDKQDEVYHQLVTQTLDRAEKIKRLQGLKDNDPSYFYRKVKAVNKLSRTLLYYINRLQAEHQQSLFDSLTTDGDANCTPAMTAERTTVLEQMFDHIWTTAIFGQEDLTALKQAFAASYLSDAEKEWMTSALTLSILFYYDNKKTELLVSLIDNEAPKVSARATVGLSLLMLYHADRFSIDAPHQLLDFRPDLSATWCLLQTFYFLTAQTVGIFHNVESGFKPLVNGMQGMITPEKMQELIEDPDAEVPPGVDADALNALREAIYEMSRQTELGFDTYYASFRNFKHAPFFLEVRNWLKPFELNTFGANHLLNRVMGQQFMCDSDLYSVGIGLDMLTSDMKRVMDELIQTHSDAFVFHQDRVDEMKLDMYRRIKSHYKFSMEPDGNLAYAISYMQDVYRLFRIMLIGKEEGNPFVEHESYVVADSPLIAPRLTAHDISIIAADAVKRGLHEQAIRLYELLALKRDLTLQEQVNMANSLSENGEKEDALQEYNDIISTYDDISNQMWCDYARLLEWNECYPQAIAIFQRVYEEDSDDVPIDDYVYCHLMLDQYQEALDVLYKEDYNNPDQRQVLRRIIYALEMSQKIEQAVTYADRLLNLPSAETSDLYLVGTTYLLSGRRKDAIRLFVKYMQQSGNQSFALCDMYEKFEVNRMPLDNVHIIEDIINRAMERHSKEGD